MMRVITIFILFLFAISLAYAAPIDHLGACISKEKCTLTTDEKCSGMSGNFYQLYLCTNPQLTTHCEPTMKTLNLSGTLHFVDSCGNPGNLYFQNTTLITLENYWSYILYEINVSAMEQSQQQSGIRVQSEPTNSQNTKAKLLIEVALMTLIAAIIVFFLVKFKKEK